MVRLETDAQFVNKIANSDAVRPFIRPDGGPTDWAAICRERFTTTGVVILSNGEDAVAAFEATAIGGGEQIFQSHTMFADSCRGRRAIDTGREMVAWMFDHGATIVWGSTPRDNRKARWFNRQIGMTPIGGDNDDEIFEIRRAG